MKKLLLFLLTVFSLTCHVNAQNYGWKDISSNIPDFPYDTTIINSGADTIIANLSDLYFIDDNEGWISTWHPYNDTAAILHTTDGGETFEVQITPLPCNAIWMLNANEGYAGGESGFIFRTTDGGNNWIFHGTITATLDDIEFPPQPADTGYACGDYGKIYKVHSSGIISMPINVATTHLSSLTFPSIEEGWVCGEQSIQHHIGGIWIADQTHASGSYSDVYFVNNSIGWAVGDKVFDTLGRIIHTTDGQNWVTQSNPAGGSLFGVFFLNTNEGWAIGSNGTIIKTTLGGTNWQVEGAGLTNAFLHSVQFTNSNNGYISGNEKTLLKYTEVSGIVEEAQAIDYELYPNPFNGKLQINCSDLKTENGLIEILSLDGKEILEYQIKNGIEIIEINLSDLKPGMYLCKLSIDKRSTTKKIIKK